MAESKLAEFNLAEFKVAAIIKFTQMNEFESDWIRLSQSFVQNGWIQHGRIQDGKFKNAAIIKLSQNEWVWVRLN